MLDHLLLPEIQELIDDRDVRSIRSVHSECEPREIADLIDQLTAPDHVLVLRADSGA